MDNKKSLYYLSGKEVLIGDKVKLDGIIGTVVFVIPSNQYSEEYLEKDWNYLKKGFGILTEKLGLVHLISPDEDTILNKRK